MLESSKLALLQDLEYDALKDFGYYCQKNNLDYFLRSGSVLGAIKYSGFVPWDDDIDVVLPRDSYNRLIKLSPNHIGKYNFISYLNNENAQCYFPRIVLNENTRIEFSLPKNNLHGLVLIDVLPLDGIPDSFFAYNLLVFESKLLRLLASVETLDSKDTVNHRTGIQKWLPIFLNKIKLHKLYKQTTIYKILDRIYSYNRFGDTNRAGVLSSSKSVKEIVPTSWWGGGCKKKFRELYVNVPSNFDMYLKNIFGIDYMSYEPPIEKRTKSHFS